MGRPPSTIVLVSICEGPCQCVFQIAKGNLNKCWNSRRKKEEINFLKQASLRASLFAVGLIMYYVLPYYFANVWVKFLFGPVTWVSEMTADG
ncbi:hypothetical protein COOONC_22436 [Cooperia oncophora]